MATSVTPYVFYSYAMIIVMFASILLGIGTKDNMDHIKKMYVAGDAE